MKSGKTSIITNYVYYFANGEESKAIRNVVALVIGNKLYMMFVDVVKNII